MIAHFAVTDITDGKFNAKEVDNLFGRLKADDKKYDVKVDKWTGREENGKQILHAEMEGYSVDLELEPVKPAALHGGKRRIVNKGGKYSNYYYSFTNMKTSGTLTIDGNPIKVEGKS